MSLVADSVAVSAGRRVEARNDAVAGLDSAGLQEQLRGGRVAADVARATLVLVTIGANDLGYDASCTAMSCYRQAIARAERIVAATLRRVRALAPGSQVVLLGYWDVWRDGAVARARGATYVRTGRMVTTALNRALASDGQLGGATYLDLTPVFRPGGRDDTALLAGDGDHPNAAGHRAVAAAVDAVVDRSAFSW